jgi:hypothetical protein
VFYAINQPNKNEGYNLFCSNGQKIIDSKLNYILVSDEENKNFVLIKDLAFGKYGVFFLNKENKIIKPIYNSIRKLDEESFGYYNKLPNTFFKMYDEKNERYDYFSENGTNFFEDTFVK